MTTPLSDIYDSFMMSISDYDFLNVTEEEVEEDLYGYFKYAKGKFHKCKKDLTVITDVNGEQFINSDLDETEIEILVGFMLVKYLKPKIITSNLINQAFTDGNFKVTSQANHLRELRLLSERLRSETSKMVTEYTYRGMTNDNA